MVRAAEIGSRHHSVGSCDLRCGVRRGDVSHHCGSAYERAQALKLARAVMPTKRRFSRSLDLIAHPPAISKDIANLINTPTAAYGRPCWVIRARDIIDTIAK